MKVMMIRAVGFCRGCYMWIGPRLVYICVKYNRKCSRGVQSHCFNARNMRVFILTVLLVSAPGDCSRMMGVRIYI